MGQMTLSSDDYIFNSSTSTICFINYRHLLTKETLIKIVNVSIDGGITIYDHTEPQRGGEISDNRLVLEYGTSLMNDSDNLQIILYTSVVDAISNPNNVTKVEDVNSHLMNELLTELRINNKILMETFDVEVTKRDLNEFS